MAIIQSAGKIKIPAIILTCTRCDKVIEKIEDGDSADDRDVYDNVQFWTRYHERWHEWLDAGCPVQTASIGEWVKFWRFGPYQITKVETLSGTQERENCCPGWQEHAGCRYHYNGVYNTWYVPDCQSTRMLRIVEAPPPPPPKLHLVR